MLGEAIEKATPSDRIMIVNAAGQVIFRARYTALGNSIAVPCAARVFRGIITAEMEVAAVAERSND